MTTTIRLATIEDAAEIARVHAESWRIAYKGIISDHVLDNIDMNRRTEGWVATLSSHGAGSLLFVSEEDGIVTGFAGGGVGRDDGHLHEAELYCIYLAGSAMGKGTGRGLYTAVADFARASGFATMYNWCLEENTDSHAFYERMGAVLVKGVDHSVRMDDETHNCVLFRRDLK